MPALEFRDVSFARPGGTRVLDHFTLNVESGEVLALVGRSGAGKTTLLKLANRLLLPDSGAVVVDGCDTREWDPIRLRRRVGYVLQDVGLFPHMTVEQNIGVVPRLEGWPAGRIAARAAELLDLIGLAPGQFASRWPDELSGGQRQRVGVARALAVDPPVLLMDEPFGALDPVTRAELQAEFRRIQKHLRKTVIIVTHDMGEAFALGDRLGVIDDGALAACDRPEGIVRSTHPTVRRLLDAVTILPAPERESLRSSAAPAAEASGGGAPRAMSRSESAFGGGAPNTRSKE
jgi:osmoprotectant transport system ATP-binding protein